MNLTSQLTALRNQSSDLTLAERAEICCRLAKQLEKAGEYETACEALSEFWPERVGPPKVDDLDEPTQAEMLLRVGALAGWLGSANQTTGSQEMAKNLITKSIEIFEGLGQSEKGAEARADLALCYWREGGFDEARVHLDRALELLKNDNSDLKACVLIRAGMVEVDARRLNEALRYYNQARPLLQLSEDHALKGAFHNEFARLFRWFGRAENVDRALIEYAAASFHFEQAGNDRYLARVENNLGYLYFTIGQYKDAHNHLDRAHHLFLELKDVGTAAQVDETRARTLLAEGHVTEAERLVRSVVRTLERGGQQANLAEALTTQGIAQARLGHHPRSKALLERAIEVAETAGDLEGAGRAKLSIIDELGEKIPTKELVSIYRSAIELLRGSQDPSTVRRLIACADRLFDALGQWESEDKESREHTWEGFSFKQHVHDGERAVIELALRDAGGSVTRAARLLGFSHHQSLIHVINSRHEELLKSRSTVRKRRRHIFSEPRKIPKAVGKAVREPTASQMSILHVDDNKQITRLVADTLGPEGIEVDSCLSGTTALKILTSDTRYDLMIVDNDLPGLGGIELVRRARNMARWRSTPIIMLSGDDCEKEAWRAGVDGFLRKPEGIDKLSATITRVLEERKERTD
jgi:CheY-like chemotaxis protein